MGKACQEKLLCTQMVTVSVYFNECIHHSNKRNTLCVSNPVMLVCTLQGVSGELIDYMPQVRAVHPGKPGLTWDQVVHPYLGKAPLPGVYLGLATYLRPSWDPAIRCNQSALQRHESNSVSVRVWHYHASLRH